MNIVQEALQALEHAPEEQVLDAYALLFKRLNLQAAICIYEPLPASDDTYYIRVLRLQPALDLDAPLEGELRVVALSLFTGYEALSYTWQSAFDDQPVKNSSIRIQDRALNITGNLDHALRRLRYTDRTRRLWVDSICIDQFDPHERAQQVEIMDSIYFHASKVLVWLGEESASQDAEFVFSICDFFKQTLQIGDPNSGELADELRRSFRQFCVDTAPQRADKVSRFAGRRYFARRWIMQELHFARSITVHCGSYCAPWNVFTASLETLSATPMQDIVKRRLGLIHAIVEWKRQAATGEHEASIIKTLCDYQDLECFDARDRLYAIMSIWESRFLKVDYTITCETLYIDFATKLVSEPLQTSSRPQGFNQVDHILMCAAYQGVHRQILTSDRSDMPTWVPDWRLCVPDIDSQSHHVTGVSACEVQPDATLAVTILVAAECMRDADVPLRNDTFELNSSHADSLTYRKKLGFICRQLRSSDVICGPMIHAKEMHLATILRPVDGKSDTFQVWGLVPWAYEESHRGTFRQVLLV